MSAFVPICRCECFVLDYDRYIVFFTIAGTPDKKQILDYAATGVIWTANPRFRRRLSSRRTCLPLARLSK